MYRSVKKFGFQRIVALLLLVTFAPLAVLSEAGHLIPGLGENCGCFKVVDASSLLNPNIACSNDHGLHPSCDSAGGVGAKSIEVGGKHAASYGECALHTFCLSFNSFSILIVLPPVSVIETELDGVELLSLSGEFYSLFQARAPPVV
jgi:hypothetical protein